MTIWTQGRGRTRSFHDVLGDRALPRRKFAFTAKTLQRAPDSDTRLLDHVVEVRIVHSHPAHQASNAAIVRAKKLCERLPVTRLHSGNERLFTCCHFVCLHTLVSIKVTRRIANAYRRTR